MMHSKKQNKKSNRHSNHLLRCAALAIVGFSGWAEAQTSVSWLSAVSGTWTDPTKWSSNPVYPNAGIPPGASYDVTLGATGQNYTVTSGSSLRLTSLSLISSETLLSINSGNFVIDGSLNLTSGTIALASNLLTNGDITGAGQIRLTGDAQVIANSTLSIASGITIKTDTGSGTIRLQASLPGLLRNDGSLLSNIAGRRLGFDALTNSASNYGTIAGANGGEIHISNLDNHGTVTINGGTLSLLGTNSNSGFMQATDATLVIGNGSTGWLNSIGRVNAPVLLVGSLSNSGTTLLLDDRVGTFTLGNGARIVGGSVNSLNGSSLRVQSLSTPPSPQYPILDGVTLNVDLQGAAGAIVYVDDGIVLNNRRVENTSLIFSANPSLTGSGTLGAIQVNSGTLTIGPNFSVEGSVTPVAGAAKIINYGTVSGASIGLLDHFGTARATGKLINVYVENGNKGNLIADNGTLSYIGGLPNLGTISAINSGTILIPFGSNEGTITSNGAYLSIGAPASSGGEPFEWYNLGTISAVNSTLSLGRTFTTSTLNSISRINADTMISGTLNNAGAALALTQAGGTITMLAGRIQGGSITTADSSVLYASEGSLVDLSLYAPVHVGLGQARQVLLENVSNYSTITVAKSATLRAVTFSNSGVVNVLGSLVLPTDWANDGTILLNQGTLTADMNAGSVSQSGTIAGDGSLIVSGTNWKWADVGHVQRTGGVLIIRGTLDNQNNTLAIDNVGTWLLNGVITGGTITSVGGAALSVGATRSGTMATGTLDGVTLDCDFLTPRASLVTLTNNLHLLNGATIRVGSVDPAGTNPSLAFAGTQSITGNGSILFDVNSLLTVTGGSLTIGQGISVGTGKSSGTFGSANRLIVNQGLVSSEVVTRRIFMNGILDNQGTIRAINGGTLALPATANLLNYSSGTLTGGTWLVGAGSTMTFGSSTITTNNSTIVLDGVGSTFAPINQLRTNLGQFTVTNARDFGSVGSLSNSGTIVVGPGSTLSVVDSFNNLSGLLDLNFKMVVDYGAASPLDELVGQIGSQIISSAVNADPGLAIGSIDDGNVVRLQIVANGDANLDGFVNYDDLATLASNYGGSNAPPGSLVAVPTSLNDPKWVDGDFNYDGAVNLTDLYALGWQYKDPQHPLAESLTALNLPAINVPEPGACAAGIAIIGTLAARRRRRF